MLTGEFRPRTMPRNGEILAWGLVAFSFAVQVFLTQKGIPVMSSLRWMLYLLLGAALLISFNNWTARRTRIRLDDEKITFTNGLRTVILRWPEIRRVAVSPASLGDGKNVLVMGERQFFRFETLGHARQHGKEVAFGFDQGEEILETLVARCGLTRHDEKNGYYYA